GLEGPGRGGIVLEDLVEDGDGLLEAALALEADALAEEGIEPVIVGGLSGEPAEPWLGPGPVVLREVRVGQGGEGRALEGGVLLVGGGEQRVEEGCRVVGFTELDEAHAAPDAGAPGMVALWEALGEVGVRRAGGVGLL